ncbi:hypothetical protein PUN28_018732 [Cardiocondyla obscurior]|uniref:Secreted protein n=1 Tax=Cardiocondyla obscurior TaxID=286306 RepID=A0AAW2EFG1_9HYME
MRTVSPRLVYLPVEFRAFYVLALFTDYLVILQCRCRDAKALAPYSRNFNINKIISFCKLYKYTRVLSLFFCMCSNFIKHINYILKWKDRKVYLEKVIPSRSKLALSLKAFQQFVI